MGRVVGVKGVVDEAGTGEQFFAVFLGGAFTPVIPVRGLRTSVSTSRPRCLDKV